MRKKPLGTIDEEELKKFYEWKEDLNDEQRKELASVVNTVSLTINDFVSESGGDRDYWFGISESEAEKTMRQLTYGDRIRSFTKETRFRGQPCSSIISYIPVDRIGKQKVASCAEEISMSIITRRPNILLAKYNPDKKLIVVQHYTDSDILEKVIGGFEEELLKIVKKYKE